MRESTDRILNYLREAAEKKIQIPAEQYIDAALKLTQLLSYEHDALIDAEAAFAGVKLDILNTQDKRNVSLAETVAQTRPEYVTLRKQQLRVSRIEETCRLSKKYASLSEYK